MKNKLDALALWLLALVAGCLAFSIGWLLVEGASFIILLDVLLGAPTP